MLKALAVSLMAVGASLLAGPAIVQASGYNSGGPSAPVSDSTPGPGESFTVTVDGCSPGETVNFEFLGDTDSDTCSGGAASLVSGFTAILPQSVGSGSASATFTAPTTAGIYSGTATLTETGTVITFTIEVTESASSASPGGGDPTASPSPDLPATGGGSSVDTTMLIAAILLVAGIGMFGVAQHRRRESTPA